MALALLKRPSMELWQVRKEYRLLAVRLRRHRHRIDPELDALEAQLLEALLWCDRFETETCILRLARRCLLGRLERTRKWVEGAGLLKHVERTLVRRTASEALERLLPLLPERGCPPEPAQQVLEELAAVTRRFEDANERLARATRGASEHLQRVLAWVRVNGPHATPSS